MTQQELEHEVASVLGEDVREIRRRGFSLADAMDMEFDPEPHAPLDRYLDWDTVQRARHVALVG